MKLRVLFVDDEPNLLEGLGRSLRGQRRSWTVEFACGGRQALDKLASAPFDVVISDMRMPDMDGAELLREARQRYPHIVRIVLASHYDKEAFLRLAGIAHRHLSKPCDPKALLQALNRVVELRSLLADEKLRALVSQVESVPSQPAIYLAVFEGLAEDLSAAKVAALARQDVGMTAKLMQIAGSVFCGSRNPALNPEEAATALGTETLRELMRDGRTFSDYQPRSLNPLHIGAVWRHSFATRNLARRIAVEEGCDTAMVDAASVAGILHDIGILVLAELRPAVCNRAWELTRNQRLSLSQVERDEFGASHAEIGAYLLGLWGLDSAIVDAVAWHHQPSKSSSTTFTPLTAVHVADALAREDDSYPWFGSGDTIDEAYLAAVGVLDRLARWRELAQDVSCEVADTEVTCA